MIAPAGRIAPGVEETRGRILHAAREIYERSGTRGTTTREVALRAGVNEATLFRHFGSKAALLTAMREHACGIDELREEAAMLGAGDLLADLRTLAGLIVASLHRKRDLLCIWIAEEAMDPSSPEWRTPSQAQHVLADYFTRRVADGQLSGEPDFLARTFMGIMFQYVIARRLWRSERVDDLVVDALVDVFLNGVAR